MSEPALLTGSRGPPRMSARGRAKRTQRGAADVVPARATCPETSATLGTAALGAFHGFRWQGGTTRKGSAKVGPTCSAARGDRGEEGVGPSSARRSRRIDAQKAQRQCTRNRTAEPHDPPGACAAAEQRAIRAAPDLTHCAEEPSNNIHGPSRQANGGSAAALAPLSSVERAQALHNAKARGDAKGSRSRRKITERKDETACQQLDASWDGVPGSARAPPLPPLPRPMKPHLQLLPPSFCRQDPVSLAPQLLGKLLRRDDVILRITEVEAYCHGDSACHGRAGITARTAPLFGAGGHAYVYLCYGLHQMLNITADEEGRGAACLIRACEPLAGFSTVLARRNVEALRPVVLAGPGKVGAALGLSVEWSGHALYESGGLELCDGPTCGSVLAGPRVGIEYAKESDRLALWRFADADSAWVSSPRKTLMPWTLLEGISASGSRKRRR